MADVGWKCEWETGTVWTGPRTCGKRARFVITSVGKWQPAKYVGLHVCGTHANVTRNRNGAKCEEPSDG